MLSVEDALAAVLSRVSILPSRKVFLARALDCILDEDVSADIDLPPFSKALVDGYAVRSADLLDGTTRLKLGEEILAGKTPSRPLAHGEAAAIMTGAPLPLGADAVVMVEKTRRAGDFVVFDDRDAAPGRNWLPRGREMSEGDVVLTRGQRLNAAKLGVLASVGRAEVLVIPRPRVVVVTTGDELVDPSVMPGPGQIRNSNATLLQALAVSAGVEVEVLPNAPDVLEVLSRTLEKGLKFDVLMITGGVSAGNRDLVPEALESLGVERIFHKVRLKPGKPLWFGVGPSRVSDQPGTLVFGLPGNPVSGVIGFLLFVRPALHQLAGGASNSNPTYSVRLQEPFRHRGDRATYHPALCRRTGTELPCVTLMDWAGSADLKTVAEADGFAIFPAGDRDYVADEIVGFLPLG